MVSRARLLLFAVGCGVSHALHAGPAGLRPPVSAKRAAPLSPSLSGSARAVAPRRDALRLKGGGEQVRTTGRAHRGARTMRAQESST